MQEKSKPASESSLKIRFVGTGEAFGSRANTSLLIGGNLLLECGFTVLNRLRRMEVPLEEIKWIFLSHLHGDHTFSLPAFLVASLEEQRKRPLDLITVEGGRKFTKKIIQLAYGKKLKDLGFKVNFHPATETFTVGPYTLSFAPLIHSVSSLGIAVEYKNVKVTYLADGNPTKETKKLAAGSDLLIAEAYHEKMENHSSPLKAAQIARDFDVEKLALVHIYREGTDVLEEARNIFPNLILPTDGDSLTLDLSTHSRDT